MRTSRRRSLIALLPLALVFAACGGGDDKADDPPNKADVEPAAEEAEEVEQSTTSWVAEATVGEVVIYEDEDGSESEQSLANPNENGAPLVFLVNGDGTKPEGDRIPVHLPVRPNGSTGWVDASDVNLASNDYRITVDVGARDLTVTEGDDTLIETKIGVGKDDAPTPGGIYYVKELLQPPNPDGPYGPFAYGLSGFSNELESLGGKGTGVIGIHGTNDPSSIDNNVSHGCIRIDNDVITEITEFLPLGTPVDINA